MNLYILFGLAQSCTRTNHHYAYLIETMRKPPIIMGHAWTAYARYAIPGPGRPLFQAATANLNPFTANYCQLSK